MLGKLMKYEWKSSGKMGGLMVLISVVVGILGAVSIYMVLGSSRWENESDFDGLMGLIGVLGIVVFMVCLVGVYYGMMVFQGVRFYKSMYGNEGYLAHTLPVSNHQLLLSKLLMGGISMLITILGMAVAVFIFAIGIFKSTEYGISMGEILGEIWEEGILDVVEDMGGALIIYLVSLLLTPFATIMGLFGSITFGQLFAKHRGLMAGVCYFVYLIANWFIRMLLWAHLSLFSAFLMSSHDYLEEGAGRYLISLLVTLAIGCGLYFLSYYINEHKLNLE